MADQERPLPKPPKKAFGFQKNEPQQGGQDLLADRMAAAAAEGRLDEFLKKELPDSEHAQALAKMMMGMTGMMPAPAPPPKKETAAEGVPEEVFKAVQGGDVKGLMDLLRKEQKNRAPDSGAIPPEAGAVSSAAQPAGQPQPTIDKELIDTLIRIASDNNVALDWIILRAIKVYVEEYQRTGKL